MKKHHIVQILTAGLLLGANAPADIVWSGEQNLSGYEQYVDLNFDSLTDVLLRYDVYIPDSFNSEDASAVLRAFVDSFTLDGSNQILVNTSRDLDAAALPYGTLISGTPDSSLEWKSGLFASGPMGEWSSPDTEWRGMLGETGEAYLGIAFDIGESTHYGWIHVILGEVDPEFGLENPITASWAYESTPDTPIVAGMIPEPSTGILTMVGSVGLLFVARSRRREKPPHRLRRRHGDA